MSDLAIDVGINPDEQTVVIHLASPIKQLVFSPDVAKRLGALLYKLGKDLEDGKEPNFDIVKPTLWDHLMDDPPIRGEA